MSLKHCALCVPGASEKPAKVIRMRIARTADEIDATLLRALVDHPDATQVALAQFTGLARNTVHARLSRYSEHGTLRSVERRIDPAFLGFPLTAFLVTTVTQRKLAAVTRTLADVPEVLQVHGLSGVTDLLIQVVARDADDLYRIAGRILDIDGVERTNTGLVMGELIEYRIAQLIAAAALA
jgi:DNA-binding Lrp family transcriptional regulator